MAIARRYELYLPLNYNTGSAIERRKFEQTRDELLTEFGGLTWTKADSGMSLSGDWIMGGRHFSDNILTYVIYTLDINRGDSFMRSYKPQLKKRFRQAEILIVGQIVEMF